MKLSEMNSRQQIATKLAWERCGWVVGGYENTIEDCGRDSEEGMEAVNALSNREELATEIYEDLMSLTDAGYLKHLRFVGKDFIMARINARLKKWGY